MDKSVQVSSSTAVAGSELVTLVEDKMRILATNLEKTIGNGALCKLPGSLLPRPS